MAELQSDHELEHLITQLREKSPLRILNGPDSHAVFRTLKQLGYTIHAPVPIVREPPPWAGPHMIDMSRKKR